MLMKRAFLVVRTKRLRLQKSKNISVGNTTAKPFFTRSPTKSKVEPDGFLMLPGF